MNRIVMPGMVPNSEFERIKAAMTELRIKWNANRVEGARVCQVPEGTFKRWMGGQNLPGTASVKKFWRACELSGIEVGDAKNE